MEHIFEDGRGWVICMVIEGKEVGVRHLFDASGSEVFDPTLAVKADTDEGLCRIQIGDEFRVTLNETT